MKAREHVANQYPMQVLCTKDRSLLVTHGNQDAFPDIPIIMCVGFWTLEHPEYALYV